MRSLKNWFPPLGLRIIKTSVAVLLCFGVYFLRGKQGIPFYSALSAIWCMQQFKSTAWNMAKQRTIGTFVGAAFGLIALLLQYYILPKDNEALYLFLVSLIIILVIYTTVLINKKEASYFSCAVFLSVAVVHYQDPMPYFFVMDRVIDTLAGIIIGVSVNAFELPRKKNVKTLFISDLENTLLSDKKAISSYTRYEINNLLQKGMKFTITSSHSPASFIPLIDGISLKLPVISMDGALLYDLKRNTYLKKEPIDPHDAKDVYEFLTEQNVNCFVNQLVGRTLMIYHGAFTHQIEESLYNTLSTSPFRNYFKTPPSSFEDIISIITIQKTERIESIMGKLKEKSLFDRLKITIYESVDYPGYSYLKIYHKSAIPQNMISILKEIAEVDTVMTIGSIKGKYDIVVDGNDNKKAIKELKKHFYSKK